MSQLAAPPSRTSPALLIALLAVGAVVGVAVARLSGMDPRQAPDAPAVATRSLVFSDRADGSIAVVDARSGALVHTVAPGEQGFIRGAMRGLARERKLRGLGADVPFELVARADGRVTLLDPATGRRIDLESFGPDNLGAFTQLLSDRRSP